MKLQSSQFTVLHNELKSTPLLSWSIIKRLLWDLDRDLLESLDAIGTEYNWHFKYFIDSFSHFKDYSIVLVDTQSIIKVASKNIVDLTGYNSKELINTSCKSLCGERTSEDVMFLMGIAMAEGIPYEVRMINYRKDKTSYMCEKHAFPIYNGDDKISHYIVFKQEYDV
ncbi:PAS domain-containing protein [Nonlabens sp.]|uniref:PAS domain-containing protein n=1 Tax=Nonlabens sp. TaxID=1888209 RepID=UPI003266D57A